MPVTDEPPPSFSYDKPSVFDEEPPFSYDRPSVFDTKPPSPRGRQALVIALAASLLAGSVAAAWWVRRVPIERGWSSYGGVLEPLDPKNPTFSEASVWFEDPKGDVQILAVEPRTSPNVEFLGAYTVWPRSRAGTGHDTMVGLGFPLEDQLKHGTHRFDERIPHSEFEKVADPAWRYASLTVGLRIASGDVGVLDGILVTYRIGNDKKRKAFFHHSILGCVKPHPCDGPDKNGLDFKDQIFESFGFRP